jgi:transposase InsO family protein
MAERGHAALVNRQKPGPKPRFLIGPVDRERMLDWRRRYGWGPTKIEGHLNVHYGMHIPHNRIHGLFVREGVNKAIANPRKTWGKRRWERLHSMSLWQVDWKDVNSDGEDPMCTFYDDHSRFVTASRRFSHATMENVMRLAEQAFRRHGMPEQILSDNGSQFVNNRSDKPTDFELFCQDRGIGTIRSSKQRPTTLGKIENFHGQYDKEAWRFGTHGAYIVHWNYHRPNGGIGYLYPCERFFNDRKSAINSALLKSSAE